MVAVDTTDRMASSSSRSSNDEILDWLHPEHPQNSPKSDTEHPLAPNSNNAEVNNNDHHDNSHVWSAGQGHAVAPSTPRFIHPVFARPLQDVCEPSTKIPAIVDRCIQFLSLPGF